MRFILVLGSLCLFTCLKAACLQNADAIHPAADVLTAPVLEPSNIAVSTPKHCDELDGVVKFSGVIDTAGLPHELRVLDASDSRLVGFATQVMESQHFKPATLKGSPVRAAVQWTVGLHTCAEQQKHPTGGNFYQFTLRAHPLIALAVSAFTTEQKAVSAPFTQVETVESAGGDISAPIPTTIADPQVPVSNKLPKHGHCYLGVTIDANGIPQNIHVVRGLAPELDSYALEAAKGWRFKPALRDGKSPVAVEGTIVGTFEYVDKEPVAFASFIPQAPDKFLVATAQNRKEHVTLETVNGDEVIARYLPQPHVAGHCIVSLVIDTNGVPQNVHIIKSLDSSVDMDTVAMVQRLRFKPVLKDGKTPVAVQLIMPVRYRITVEKPTWRDLFFDLATIPILLLM